MELMAICYISVYEKQPHKEERLTCLRAQINKKSENIWA